MKKSAILASAIALAVSGSAIAASHASASGVTVYGKSRAVVQINDTDSGMSAGSTRFGFKGSEDIGNGMTVSYKLEMGYAHVTGSAPTGRSGFVAINGGFGSVAFGKTSNPRYALVEGYFGPYMSGAGGKNADSAVGGSSTKSAITYTNKFGDIKFMGQVTSEKGNADDAVTNGTSFGISVPVGPVTLGVAVEADIGAVDQEYTGFSVKYADGPLTAGVAIIDKNAIESVVLQATFTTGANKFLVTAVTSDDKAEGVVVGFHHKLSKRTTVLVEINGGDYADHTGIGINHNF